MLILAWKKVSFILSTWA